MKIALYAYIFALALACSSPPYAAPACSSMSYKQAIADVGKLPGVKLEKVLTGKAATDFLAATNAPAEKIVGADKVVIWRYGDEHDHALVGVFAKGCAILSGSLPWGAISPLLTSF